MPPNAPAKKILFVCLGNICRSPLAEAALRSVAVEAGLAVEVDSAGTGGWHVGDPPDPRAQAIAKRHGLDISHLAARQVTEADFRRFDHIFALDPDNLAGLRRIAPADATAQVSLLLDLVPGRRGQGVHDPYYGDAAGFEATWRDVEAAARVLVERLRMSDLLAARAAALAGGTLADTRRLAGGNLSEVIELRLADGRRLVAKTGASAPAEADMLRAIAGTGAPAPAVVGVEADLLVMEAAPDECRLGGPAWARLADALALLHRPTDEPYGWPVDHAFGSVAIVNARSRDWPTFWGENRLACHLPHVDAALGRRLAALVDRLGDLLSARPPSALLHGDLWGGNVLVGGDAVTLIDPACYYGDREFDLAMLTLFDAPPERFFAAMDLEPGWRARLPIYRLWPLLVHLRLFGSGYRAQVEVTLAEVGV